ncbi:Late embryogenesis abundant protein 18 [Zea mays]|jgi:hypothetical protein|uniref:Seed maturation protein n=2 Tax=Zea mays TaxID=4577 RepID=B6UGJ4_MAIZE|nr:uncharacterized protein LOC100286326 [Zea mays]ACG48477.1 seed maturation protein [Zea mays]ACG48944.1 seed maturation protein [Zea mays]AQK45366.1 Seed maturation protein [Zea mays]PWZ44215.1 Late embryogenesis abundant protein 18 [Zea mays]|eukprot:NP_001152685.1 uncharacterized protein LOC100286326 [Zea mays]
MQTAKVKAKDMVSSAKEKVKEGSAKMQGKTGEATAATHGEKEMAKEAARAKKDQANADKHQEKADHRADAATGHHGTRVPLTGPHGHHGAGAAVDPAYPSSGNTYPASGKYI